MSKSPQPRASQPQTPDSKTALDVIEMFRGIDLPVTDDEALIKRKITEQRPRRLRDKGGFQTNPHIRAEADEWFKNIEALQNRRAALIKVVYDQFAETADLALKGAFASGVHNLTQDTVNNLADLARTSCHVDDALTRRFIEDFLGERGISLGEPFIEPGTVEDLKAETRKGVIKLTWRLPSKNWEKVEIYREEEHSPTGRAKKSQGSGVRVYSGSDTKHEDRLVMPGTWYTYYACAVYQGVQGARIPQTVPCIGEVRKLTPTLDKGSVVLTWELASSSSSVWVFRREGSRPAVHRGADGLEPDDGKTRKLWNGSGTSYADSKDIVEGAEYHYLVVSDFGQDFFSEGEVATIWIDKPPDPVRTVTAEYTRIPGRPEVKVEWTPASGGSVSYAVVRREGATAAGAVKDGDLVDKPTMQTSIIDPGATAGKRYIYTVFTCVGTVYSKTGAASKSVSILADVTGLKTTSADTAIELSYSEPAITAGTVFRVVIRRSSTTYPDTPTSGDAVAPTSKGYGKDTGLTNGVTYYYRVWCAYKPDGKTEEFSDGATTPGVPECPPEPVRDFKAVQSGSMVICKWTPPTKGTVMVRRFATPHGLSVGNCFDKNQLTHMGAGVSAGKDQAVDRWPALAEPYYSIFTVLGSYAVTGGPMAMCAVIADVTDLQHHGSKAQVELRWQWPANCTAVTVARRADDWPRGPADARANPVVCTLSEYNSAGDKYVDRVGVRKDRLYYIVYAMASGPAGPLFSRGEDQGCRRIVPSGQWMTLRYGYTSAPRGKTTDARIRVLWQIEDPLPNFAGFSLLANQRDVPGTGGDDVELFSWKPAGQIGSDAYEEVVSLAPIIRKRWTSFYCKLALIDPVQSAATLVVHPDTCAKITADGQIQRAVTAKGKGGYRPGTPWTLICSECFQEFPVEQMKFSTYESGDTPATAKYTVWDKLAHLIRRRRWTPKVPTDRRGNRMTRKFCPQGHELAFTAGLQDTLIIGLIGAVASGKTTYIAALVDRLSGEAGGDIDAALLPVTDDTSERYKREFYEPLFTMKKQLAKSVGTPPPLIYDLSVNGRIWNEQHLRSVNLALYDTAGENLDNPRTAEHLVKYVRRASGIMLLVDPLQIPKVRGAVPEAALPTAHIDGTPNGIIANVFRTLQDGHALGANDPLSIPVAVVFTKCDVLKDAGLIKENRLWSMGDRRHIGYFDMEVHNDISGMMGEYMRQWDSPTYQTISQRFPNHAFFAVSATGCAPDAIGQYKSVSPFRVQDPLFWLLAQLNVLPVR